jgi:hypothetical protein
MGTSMSWLKLIANSAAFVHSVMDLEEDGDLDWNVSDGNPQILLFSQRDPCGRLRG